MSRKAWLYIFIVWLAAMPALGVALTGPAPASSQWLPFVVLTLLAIACQFWETQAPGNQSYYPHLVFFSAGLLLLEPSLFFLLIIIPHLVEWAVKRLQGKPYLRQWYIQPFNIATHIVAGALAQRLLTFASPLHTAPLPGSMVVVGLALLSYGVCNHLIIGQALVLARGISWQESGVLARENIITDLSMLLMGYIVYLLWQLNAWLILPALAPLLLISRALQVPALEKKAQTDIKTDLVNATHWRWRFNEELKRAKHFQHPLSIVMIDLDGLRNINNQYGHLAGDAVLIGIAQTLKKNVREYDLVGRFGGEEFAVILPELDAEGAWALAEKLRQAVAAAIFKVPVLSTALQATASFGVATFPQHGATSDQLIYQADLALYQAKANGKNCVVSALDHPPSMPIEQPSALAISKTPFSTTAQLARPDSSADRTVSPILSQQKLQQADLEHVQREYEQTAVLTMASAMRVAKDRPTIIPIILNTLLEIFGAQAAAFSRFSGLGNEQVIEQGCGAWHGYTGRRFTELPHWAWVNLGKSTFYRNNTIGQDANALAEDFVLAEPLPDVKAIAGVLLETPEQRIGTLWIGRQHVITEQDLHILAALSSMVAHALQRIHRQTETSRRAEALAAINQLCLAIGETFELAHIHEQICQTARIQLPEISSLFIEYYDPTQKLLKVVYGYQQGQTVELHPFAPLLVKEPVLKPHEHAFLIRQRAQPQAALNAPQPSAGAAAIVVTPMVAHGQVVGVLQVQGDSTDCFNQTDQEFLALLANTAAVFIQNALLFENLQCSKQRVQQELNERQLAEATIGRQLAVIEHSIDGIVLVDSNQTYRYVNIAYAELYGYRAPQDLIGKAWHSQYPEVQQQYLQQTVAPILRSEGRWRGEVTGVRADGSTFQQEMSAVHLGDSQFAWIVRDITERKQAAEALHRSQKLESLGLLAGGVAHDFNNLLAGILGQVSWAKSKLPVSSPVYDNLTKAITTTTRAVDLTRQLLIYAGKGMAQIKPFNINDLLNENIGLLEAVVPKQIQLTFALSDDTPLVEGDIGQIQQVLMNLIINAADAIADQEGHIIIQSNNCLIGAQAQVTTGYTSGVMRPGTYVRIAIMDDGVGMDKNMLERIFDPFFSTKGYSRGLGLSATEGIIRQHKGYLSVNSEPGKGSTFQVFLPVAIATNLQLCAEPVAEIVPVNLTSTILVIDDEAFLRDIFSEALGSLGSQVITAENGLQGIEALREHAANIALIVLDMQMPVMNGLSTLKEIMKINPNMRIILTSGYNDYDLPDLSTNYSSVVFLQKPYSIDTFLQTVKEQLRSSVLTDSLPVHQSGAP